LAGSATPYLNVLQAALTGTLVSNTVFAPENVAVWGPGGQFGGELYFLSIIEGLPRGALLEERKAVFFQFPGQSDQTFFDVTFYFPLEAYHHTPSTAADGFMRLHFDQPTGPGLTGTEGSPIQSATRTFASFASFAGDFSNAQGFVGTANNPPLAITFLTGTQVRYEASYRVIAGTEGSDWSLLGQAISPRGYRFGTGFTPHSTATIIPVGSVRVTSTVVTMPPVCGPAHASPASLWPPNHALVSVAIVDVTDPDDHQVSRKVKQVTQDEPVNGLGDGDTSPDAVLQAGGKVLLRAERAGTGNGRVYHVTFMADDGSGGQCEGVVKVCVPHDQGKGKTCIDDGPQYNSLQP
jgi:hypothetical protein